MKRINLQKREIILLSIIGVLMLSLLFLFSQNLGEDEIISEEMFVPIEQEPIQEEVVVKTILVDIKGAVLKPGVYELPGEARVIDGIEKAGGFSALADETTINLAQKLSDEMAIYVPEEGEKILDIGNEAGKIDLNRTTVDELQQLSGIGPSKAQAIIDYRERFGHFKSVEDIVQVTGIGDATLNKIRDEIVVR